MKHVFLLWHSHDLGEGETDDKLVGVYSTADQARAAKARKLQFEGFKDSPEGFLIDRYELDRDAWSEGYITACPETEEMPVNTDRHGEDDGPH